MNPNAAPSSPRSTVKPLDPSGGIQFVLLLDIGIRLLVWTTALAVTLWLCVRYGWWPHAAVASLSESGSAWVLAQRLGHLMLVFNFAYLSALLVLGMIVPCPRWGRYELRPGQRPDVNLLWSCFRAVLAKARYQAPFPAVFVPQLANVQPFRWLFNLRFGPFTRTSFLVEPHILDPHGITIGRNVTLGFNTTVAAHLQERDSVTFAPTTIEDDVLVGGYTVIAGGVHIKRGAVIGGCSFLKPGTVVGENEFWGGVPAKKIRDLGPYTPGAGAERTDGTDSALNR